MAIERLRAAVRGKPEGVDREARVIRGYVLAQEGPFKSAGRGEFDLQSLESIVSLGNSVATGLKVRFGHPTESDDGLGKYLGRSRDLRLDKAVDARTGKQVSAVRGDLHFAESASKTPNGDLASYVMDLAGEDSDAISSSLVLSVDMEYRLDKKGVPLKDDEGEPLPPLWRPTKLFASDIVDTGDAVDGLLSAHLSPDVIDKLMRFDGPARLGTMLAGFVISGLSRTDAEKKLNEFVARLLDERFGVVEKQPTPRLDALRARLTRMCEESK